MAFDCCPGGVGVLRVKSATERLHSTGKLLERNPQDFPETIRVKHGVRQDIPVPEAVGRALERQEIPLLTLAQILLRPAVPHSLDEQTYYKQGHDDTEKSKDDDCRLYGAQSNSSIACGYDQIFLESVGNRRFVTPNFNLWLSIRSPIGYDCLNLPSAYDCSPQSSPSSFLEF